MKKLALIIALLAIVDLATGGGFVFAQTPGASHKQASAPTNVENWTIKQWNSAKREWAKDKSQWADCRQQSMKQKLTGRKSWSFLYTCMSTESRPQSASTRNHHSAQATMRISDSSNIRIRCQHESRFYESGY